MNQKIWIQEFWCLKIRSFVSLTNQLSHSISLSKVVYPFTAGCNYTAFSNPSSDIMELDLTHRQTDGWCGLLRLLNKVTSVKKEPLETS